MNNHPSFRAHSRLCALLGALCSVAVPESARAEGDLQAYLTTLTAPSNYLVTSSSIYDGVAKLVVGGAGCSGALVGDGGFVLTAAHCVANGSTTATATSMTITFSAAAGSPSVTVNSAQSAITLAPGWTGDFQDGSDLALIKLPSPITGITSYDIVTDSWIGVGSSVIVAGYGLVGTGAAGYTAGTFGTLHVGTNIFDSLWAPSAVAGSVFRYDFDDGQRRQNASGTPTPTASEAMIAPGDSGGPSFVSLLGELYILGVHSFGSTLGQPRDLDGVLNASFGELGGDTNVPLYSTWLASVIGVAPVPEPGSYALMLPALGLIWLRWRGRRQCRDARPAVIRAERTT